MTLSQKIHQELARRLDENEEDCIGMRELARKCDVNVAVICKWLHEPERAVSRDTIDKLAAFFNICEK